LPDNTQLPWERYRARNRSFLAKLSAVYGAYAVVARQGDLIVGQLRFYPKAVWDMAGAGYLCLQQDHPWGPEDGLGDADFPALETLPDRTLKVHCLMIRAPAASPEQYHRRGIGTRMARTLIDWAREKGWGWIEAEAFEDLPVIYQVTGSTGQSFWAHLGFSVVDRHLHPYLREPSEFRTTLEEQAKAVGLDPNRAKDCIVMRLELS
jgi:GNAT superfamily N-acetyltransferase